MVTTSSALIFTLLWLGFDYSFVTCLKGIAWKNCFIAGLLSLGETNMDLALLTDPARDSIKLQCKEGVNSYNNLHLEGSGGTGRVYSYNFNEILKVSYPQTIDKVNYECEILKYMQTLSIKNVPICKELCVKVESAPAPMAVVSIMSPYFGPHLTHSQVVSSFDIIDSPDIAKKAIRAFLETVVSMLSYDIVSSDLQFLVDDVTGELLLIDFTEAIKLQENDPLRQAKSSSFISEALSNIPGRYETFALRELNKTLKLYFNLQQLSERYPFLSNYVITS